MAMPDIRPAPLSPAEHRRFALLLTDAAFLPDACAHLIAWLIAAHKQGRKLARGHTPARVAAALARIEGRLRRGHDGPEAVCEITDPLFGIDGETHTRLAPIVADPDVPLDRRLAAIEARRREVEAMREIDPRYGLRVQLAAWALAQVWHVFAVDRGDTVRQWQFVLAILDAAGEGTEGLREHPERLKRDVGQLMQSTVQPVGAA
jgi:hypothetical protein